MGDEIARMAANIDAAVHRLLFCIRVFDQSGEWGTQGALSCAHWLMWRIGLDEVTAREKVRVARALGELPTIDQALGRGELSYAKVRAMTRVATPENEERLLEMARYMSGAQLEKLVRKLRMVSSDPERRERRDDDRHVSETILPSGMAKLTMVLHPDEAAVVMKAIEKARAEAPPVSPDAALARQGDSAESSRCKAEAKRPPKPRMISRADAVMKVASSFLETGEKKTNGGGRYQVLVHLEQCPIGPDGRLAASLDDGTRVSAETFKRITCDCSTLPVLEDEHGSILNLGRRRRTISPALRRALLARDQGCRFPGCTNRLFASGHHIKHWIERGETSKKNCCLLCDAHHHMLHEGRFTLEGDPDAELLFRNRYGAKIEAVPHPEGGSVWSLLVDGSAEALDIDADTNAPQWDSEPIDWDACIHAMG